MAVLSLKLPLDGRFNCISRFGIALILAGSAFAAAAQRVEPLQPGVVMPALEGESLAGKNVVLPKDAAGKVGFIALGFSRNSQYSIEKWMKRFKEDFKNTPGVIAYTVPVIEGSMGHMAKPFITGGMRKGMPKEDQPTMVPIFTSSHDWYQRMQVSDENLGYLIVIDQQGKVAWVYRQAYSDDVYNQLVKQVRMLLAGR
jgi:ATP10 protein